MFLHCGPRGRWLRSRRNNHIATSRSLDFDWFEKVAPVGVRLPSTAACLICGRTSETIFTKIFDKPNERFLNTRQWQPDVVSEERRQREHSLTHVPRSTNTRNFNTPVELFRMHCEADHGQANNLPKILRQLFFSRENQMFVSSKME